MKKLFITLSVFASMSLFAVQGANPNVTACEGANCESQQVNSAKKEMVSAKQNVGAKKSGMNKGANKGNKAGMQKGSKGGNKGSRGGGRSGGDKGGKGGGGKGGRR